MINSNDIFIEKFNIKNFTNAIDCEPILNILKELKKYYDIYKTNKRFLDLLYNNLFKYYLVSDNYQIKLIINKDIINNFIDDDSYFILLNDYIVFVENKICLNYLKNKINDKLFMQQMNEFFLTELKKDFVKKKKISLEENEILALSTKPNMINCFTNIDLINILNKNNKPLDKYKNIYTEFIDSIYERLGYETILLNTNILQNKDEIISPQCFKLNNLKKYNITKEKKKLFNNNKSFFIQEEILYEFTYFIVNRNATFTERSLYYDVLTFIFYGLYFELFTKEELFLLNKTGSLFELFSYVDKKDFDLLLKKNNFELNQKSNIEIYKYQKLILLVNEYENNNIDLEYNVYSNNVRDNLFLEELILISKSLVRYNTIKINTVIISGKDVVNNFKKYANIFSQINNITEKEFLELVENKLLF